MRVPSALQFGLAVALSLTSGAAAAQQMDIDRVVPPLESNPKTLEDYLVQQAWLNTLERRELEAEVAFADAETQLARRSWTNQVGANVNVATQQQEYQAFGQQYLAPGLNFGASINLGAVVNNKARVRLAETKADIARARIESVKPTVRGDVALALEAIETTRELLRIRRRAEVDAETNYTLVQSLYEQGKAQFEDLAQASQVFFDAVTATAVAKSDQARAQIELQTLTGLTIQQIEEARRRYAVR